MTDETVQRAEDLIAEIQESIDRCIRHARTARWLRNWSWVLQAPLLLVGIYMIHRGRNVAGFFDVATSIGCGILLWRCFDGLIDFNRKWKKTFAEQRNEVKAMLDYYKARKERGFE